MITPDELDEMELLAAQWEMITLPFAGQAISLAQFNSITPSARSLICDSVPRLVAECRELHRKGESLCHQNGTLMVEMHDLRKSLRVATEALEFFATRSNVPMREIVDAFMSNGSTHDTMTTYTQRARAALAAIRGKHD